jgi:hypothetical protein
LKKLGVIDESSNPIPPRKLDNAWTKQRRWTPMNTNAHKKMKQ